MVGVLWVKIREFLEREGGEEEKLIVGGRFRVEIFCRVRGKDKFL